MNERIRELAEQARQHFPKTETSGEFWVFDEQKFAELIIRECCRITDEVERANLPVVASKFVKAHFGVDK